MCKDSPAVRIRVKTSCTPRFLSEIGHLMVMNNCPTSWHLSSISPSSCFHKETMFNYSSWNKVNKMKSKKVVHCWFSLSCSIGVWRIEVWDDMECNTKSENSSSSSTNSVNPSLFCLFSDTNQNNEILALELLTMKSIHSCLQFQKSLVAPWIKVSFFYIFLFFLFLVPII